MFVYIYGVYQASSVHRDWSPVQMGSVSLRDVCNVFLIHPLSDKAMRLSADMADLDGINSESNPVNVKPLSETDLSTMC